MTPAVDLGAHAGITQVGVNGIGEVDRAGPPGQGDDLTARRKAENLVLEHLQLGVLQELLGVRGVLQDIQQLAHPAVLPPVDVGYTLLVGPVSGHAEFGELMHFPGAYLHFDAVLLRPDQPGVQRFIAVGLRGGYVVLEAPWDHGIAAVQDPQHLIGVRHGAHHHAKGHDVGELLEGDVALLHLPPDRIGRLDPA